MCSLHDSLVDALVAVGVNSSSGLVPSQIDDHVKAENHDDPCAQCYEPQLLAAISADVAHFPFSVPQQDPQYPPNCNVSKSAFHGNNVYSAKSDQFTSHKPPTHKKIHRVNIKNRGPRGQDGDTNTLERNGDVPTPLDRARKQSNFTRKSSFRFRAVDLVKNDQRKDSVALKPTELPMNSEKLNSLTSFCFPDGLHIYHERPPDVVHFLVLTDVMGKRSYATCLTYHRKSSIKSTKDGGWCLLSSHCRGDTEAVTCYIPICFVLVSSQPYMFVMKDCLSRLVYKIGVCQDDGDIHQVMKEFCLQLTLTVLPPPGPLVMNFILHDVTLPVVPPASPWEPVVDIPLNLVFQHLSAEDIISVLTCFLTQQKIVFISSSYAMLTVITLSFLHFLHPFKWSLTYVPVLPNNLLELIDAPTSFVLGCHCRYRRHIEQLSDVVVIDIDNGNVTLGDEVILPDMPQVAKDMFIVTCQGLFTNQQLHILQSPTSFSYEDSKAAELRYRQEFNHLALNMFLQLHITLFRETLSFIRGDGYFKQDEFVKSRQEKERAFFEQVTETEVFCEFIEERSLHRADLWSLTEERTRPANRKSVDLDRLPLSIVSRSNSSSSSGNGPPRSSSFPSLSTQISPIPRDMIQRETQYTNTTSFTLPTFLYGLSGLYIESCVQDITKAIRECERSSIRASYLYMRGMLQAAMAMRVPALEDFHSLRAHDSRIFPHVYSEELIKSMTPAEKNTLEGEAFFQSGDWKTPPSEHDGTTDQQPVILRWDQIPDKEIDIDAFLKLVFMLEIALDFETIGRLFRALTLETTTVVDPGTFNEFYKCWKEGEVMRRKVILPEQSLEAGEDMLHLSEMVKTSLGTGRVALTHKRLFFLADGSKKCRTVLELCHIENLELLQQKSFFTQSTVLKITLLDGCGKAFVACLKEASPLWLMMVGEMWAGSMTAREVREPGLELQASRNVMLLDAVLKSSEADFCAHYNKGDQAGMLLCYFTKRREAGLDRISPDSREHLYLRVDPNSREVKRVTVEALLYTPPRLVSEVTGEEWPGQLWCGLGSDKVVVYNADTWTLEKQVTEARKKVVCLLAVGDSQVWAGSFDGMIYVIDIGTRTCNQRLSEHTDHVCDITRTDDSRNVYSGSLNGQIVGWNVSSMQPTCHIQLEDVSDLRSLSYIDQYLWCLTRQKLLAVSVYGKLIHVLQYFEPDKMSPSAGLLSSAEALDLDCFLHTDYNELWLGCRSQGDIAIYDCGSMTLKHTLQIPCCGVCKMIDCQDRVWVGSKEGKIYIFNSYTHQLERSFWAHNAPVRSMCQAETLYVISGSGSQDGKLAIWTTDPDQVDSDDDLELI